MKAIGGYFELELHRGREYHQDAIRLNTGRNAFEYILRAKKYKKVFLPYYTCDVMLEPINKLKLKYEFYHIDETFRPVFDFATIAYDEVFVYTNYFGICDIQALEVTSKCANLVIDNSQSFFSQSLPNVDTFYSPRKFFGVPDGGYLYTNKKLEMNIETDNSSNRFSHLIGRIENGTEESYPKFKENEQNLCKQSIKKMSRITQRLLQSINYMQIADIRKVNFQYLNDNLGKRNLIHLDIKSEAVPMVYPFRSDNEAIRTKLANDKIYVGAYWPNVLSWCDEGKLEYGFPKTIMPLPIDQRYDINQLSRIIEAIEKK